LNTTIVNVIHRRRYW